MNLTPCEKEVARCVRKGWNISEISIKLNKKPRTIKSFLVSIYKKFGIKSDRFNSYARLMVLLNLPLDSPFRILMALDEPDLFLS